MVRRVNTTFIGVATGLSIILFILCIIPAIAYFIRYALGKEIKKLSRYFTYNTISTIILNVLCSTFIMVYFVWILLDPVSSNEVYYLHESHSMRMVIGILYTVGTMFPFFIYNGRLRYAFKIGKYRTSHRLFTVLNVIVIIVNPSSLIVGYLCVFVYSNPYLAWIGFNGYRILYIILLLLLSHLFNKRIFIMMMEQTKLTRSPVTTHQALMSHTSGDDGTLTETDEFKQTETDEFKHNNNNSDTSNGDSNSGKLQIAIRLDDDQRLQLMEYLNMVIKSSLLLSVMILSKVWVMTIWFLHNYALNSDHLSYCIGILSVSFDSFIAEICIILLYKYSQRYYALICACSKEDQLNDLDAKCGAHFCYSRCCAHFCYSEKSYEDDDNS